MDRDIELNVVTIKEDSPAQGRRVYRMREPAYNQSRRSRAVGWLDSFRRDPDRTVTPKLLSPTALGMRNTRGQPYFDLHSANLATANSGLSRELKGRHLQMIAIGGSIGPSPPPPPLSLSW